MTDEEFFEMNRVYIELRSQQLYEQAEALCAIFHEARRAYIEAPNKNRSWQSPYLGCRVKQNPRGPGLTIEWFRYEYYGPRSRRAASSTYIKKGEKSTYSQHAVFNWQTLDWEKEMFYRLEPEFATIRKQSLLLGKISRQTKLIARALEKIKTPS